MDDDDDWKVPPTYHTLGKKLTVHEALDDLDIGEAPEMFGRAPCGSIAKP